MINDLSTAHIYTDFSGLAELKRSAKQQSPETLREVANQFESMFVKMLLKQMREASLGEGIFDSDESRFYQDIMDHQIALNVSSQHSLGIADMIVRQLQSTDATNSKAPFSLKPLPEPIDINPFVSKITKSENTVNKSMPEFNSRDDFIRTIKPYAETAARELGISADILIAQSALETGWGKKIIKTSDGQSSFNLFGIKADSEWTGPMVRVNSLEYVNGLPLKEYSNFRAYESFQHSFDDYVDFIKTHPRYQDAIRKNDGQQYIQSLQAAGYATDPHYAEKIIDIVKRGVI